MTTNANKPPLTREAAMEIFRQLVHQYGIQWTAKVPRHAYDELARVNTVLTEADRREALGLPSGKERR